MIFSCFCNFQKQTHEHEKARSSNLESKWSKDDLDLLGVSIYHLQHSFMNDVRDAGLNEDSKIYEIEDLSNLDDNGIVRQKGAHVICPIDGKKGAAYIHSILFDEDDDEDPEDHFGKAQVMLSYTWGYTIGDIIHTLGAYCKFMKLDPKRVYVWICFLCVNQHRVIERKKCGESVPFVDFREIFEKRVINIGHLLPMMSPWHNPEYLKRVWCLFELIIAKRYGCKVTMIMPDKERADFLKMFDDENTSYMDNMSRLYEVFSSIRVQDAEASEEFDRINIMQIIETSPGGYATFNVEVNELVREWAIGMMKDEVATRRESVVHGSMTNDDFVCYLVTVGNVFDDIGEKRGALAFLQESLSIYESLYGRKHQHTATAMNSVAAVMSNLGQKEESLQIYQEVLTIRKFLFGKDHYKTANTMNNLALVMSELGQKEEALRMYQEVISIYESLFGKHHAHTAMAMNNMALVMSGLGQNEKALQIHKEVFSIRKYLFGKNHSDTADTMNNMALAMSSLGQKKEALEMYQEVLPIFKSLLGKNHAKTATTMYNVANVMDDLGRKEEALQMFRKALAVFESVLGPDHPDAVDTRHNIAYVSREIEN